MTNWLNYTSTGSITVDSTSSTATAVTIDWGWNSTTDTFTIPNNYPVYHIPIMAQRTAGVAGPVDDGVTRRKPPLEFNKYINASDLMEEFIAFLRENHVRQGEVMTLPLEMFIKWLIIRACEQDGEEPEVHLTLPAPRQQPRCLGCGQFMAKDIAPNFHVHDAMCATRYISRAR